MVGEGALLGGLLGSLVGDCVGAPFEGAPTIDRSAAPRRVAHALARPPLRYTDDTELTLALAEHLVDDARLERPDDFVARILARYDGRRGYGGGMRRLVRLWRAGHDHRQAATAIFADGSLGNGAAMRVAPVGLLWAHDTVEMARVARRQAEVTHVHPIGVDAAVIQAAAVAVAARDGAFGAAQLAGLEAATDEVRAGLAAAVRLAPEAPAPEVVRTLGAHVTAHRSVPAALWCAATSPDVEAAVTTALSLGGDADTIAAMAGAVRGAADGPSSVPAAWLEAVEGRDEVRDVAAALRGARHGGQQGAT
jgi:poly(ADP-ribose) glycohydrolase ARH3